MSEVIFLDVLMDEMANLTEEDIASAHPEESVRDGEIVLGILHPKIRLLHVIRSRKIDELNSWIKSLRPPSNAEELREITSKKELIESRLELISNLFWFSVREQFPSAQEKNSIGIRTEWKIVWRKEWERRQAEKSEKLLGLITSLFNED